MNLIAETKRLYLREFILEDARHLYDMNNDPEVIKYTGDDSFKKIDEAVDFLKNYSEYKQHNMGRWAVCLKESNEFLGWCGLKYHPDEKLHW